MSCGKPPCPRAAVTEMGWFIGSLRLHLCPRSTACQRGCPGSHPPQQRGQIPLPYIPPNTRHHWPFQFFQSYFSKDIRAGLGFVFLSSTLWTNLLLSGFLMFAHLCSCMCVVFVFHRGLSSNFCSSVCFHRWVRGTHRWPKVLCAQTGFLRLGGGGFGQSDPQVPKPFLLNGWSTQGGVSQSPDSVGLDASVFRAELGGEPWVSFFPHRHLLNPSLWAERLKHRVIMGWRAQLFWLTRLQFYPRFVKAEINAKRNSLYKVTPDRQRGRVSVRLRSSCSSATPLSLGYVIFHNLHMGPPQCSTATTQCQLKGYASYRFTTQNCTICWAPEMW